MFAASGESECEGSEDSSGPVGGLVGNELGEAVFAQGGKAGRIHKGGQDVQAGVGNQ